MRIITLDDRSMENILADMLKRDPNNYDSYTQTVEAIVNDVRNRRDEAVFEYTAKFDHAYLDASGIRVTEAEIQEAMEQVDESLKNNPVYNPSQEILDKCEVFVDLSDALSYYNAAWEKIRLS